MKNNQLILFIIIILFSMTISSATNPDNINNYTYLSENIMHNETIYPSEVDLIEDEYDNQEYETFWDADKGNSENTNQNQNSPSKINKAPSTTKYTTGIIIPKKIEAGQKINIKIKIKCNDSYINNGTLSIRLTNNTLTEYPILIRQCEMQYYTTSIFYTIPSNFNGIYKIKTTYSDTEGIIRKISTKQINIIPKTFINSTVCNITVHNYTELKEAITTTNKENITINLAGSSIYNVTSTIILDIPEVTINGYGTIIQCNNSVRTTFIQINENTSLCCSNMLFQNYNYTLGPIFFNKGSLILNNNTFTRNIIHTQSIFQNECNLTLNQNIFNFNFFVMKGSALYLNKSSKTHINNCSFENNKGSAEGFIIRANNFYELSLKQSIFNNNSNIKLVYLLNTTKNVTNNLNETKIINSTFINNWANDELIHNYVHMSLSNSSFINNNSTKSCTIYSSNTLTIDNTTFNNNFGLLGGSIYLNNTMLNLINVTFENNTSIQGGAIYSNESEIYIKNSNFNRNIAQMGGAILQISNKIIDIKNSIFNHNKATKYDGGVLYVVYSWLNIENSTFNNNFANVVGGVISIELSDICSIKSSTFTNNNAYNNGSILFSRQNNVKITNNALIPKNNKNAIFIDQTSQFDLDNNWWGDNTPDFKLFTNNLIPNSWIQMIFTNKTVDQLNILNFSLNQLSTGESYDEKIPARKIILKIGNSTKNLKIIGSKIYNYQGNEKNITAKIDNQTIHINTKVEPYFISEDIMAKIGERINLTAKINKDYKDKTCIKINGITLKYTNGSTIYVRPNNGLINQEYKIPSTNKEKLTVEYVCGENKKYQSKRIYSTIFIDNVNQTLNTFLISSIKQDPLLSADDKIAVPGKKLELSATIDKKITGNVILKINNDQITTLTINKGILKYNYTIPVAWQNSYNNIQKVSWIFEGNKEYESKTIISYLYIQKNNTNFDLRDYDFVTNVKNQGQSSSCWAFGLYSALESNIKKYSNQTMDFSENNLKNLLSRTSVYGTNEEPNTAKSTLKSIGLLINWLNPINETDDNYYDASTYSPHIDSSIHLQDIIFLPNRKFSTDNDIIKRYVLNYGAVGTVVHPKYQNYKNWYDSNLTHSHSHLVAIIGWDDNYSKNNFNDSGKIPEGNGAFLIKNSWGTNIPGGGYSYISYYDKTLAGINDYYNYSSFVFNLKNTNKYSGIYSNTLLYNQQIGINNSKVLWVNNTFKAKAHETINAIGTYIYQHSNITIYIYKNNKLQYQQDETATELGYQTIPLINHIPMNINDNFSIILKINSKNPTKIIVQDYLQSMINFKNYSSLISNDGITWLNLSFMKYSACLNAYTVDTKQYFETKTKIKNDNLTITTYIRNYPVNATIKYYINNKFIKEISNTKNDINQIFYNLTNITRKEFNLTTVVINDGEIMNESLTLIKDPTYTKSQLLLASKKLRNYININHTIPETIIINSDTININDYLYLISCLIYSNSSTYTLKTNYEYINSITKTNCYNEEINMTTYQTLAKLIKTNYENKGTNLYKFEINNYTFSYNDIIYLYSGAGQFLLENNRQPNYMVCRDYQTGYTLQYIQINCPTNNIYTNTSTKITTYLTYNNNTKVNGVTATIKINGTKIKTTTVKNGQIEFTYTPTKQGQINLTITTNYLDNAYNSTKYNKIITITKKTPTINTTNWQNIKKNDNITLNIKLTDNENNTINTGKIQLIYNQNTLKEYTITNATTKITYNPVNLKIGINSVTIKYLENNNYKETTTNIIINIQNQIQKFTYNQVLESATWTKNNIKNKQIPTKITINGTQITKDNYLYLLCEILTNNKTYTTINTETNYPNITTNTGIIINKTTYTQYAKTIQDHTQNNNKQMIKTNFGYISYNDTILLYTNIIHHLHTNKKLPEKIKIESLTQTQCQTPTDYTIIIPCYINTTLKQVITTNNKTYDNYIIKEGTNGIIKIPTTRIMDITIPDKQKTYTFTNKQLQNNIHNLQTNSAYITLDGTKTNCTNTLITNEKGIHIYTENDNIIIKYHNIETQNINQFSITYNSTTKKGTTNQLPRTNSTLYTENIIINTNNKNNAIITFTEGIKYDDTGLKYQIYKQTNTNTNFNTITLTTLLNKYPQINYTNTNEKLIKNNNKILRNNITDTITTIYQTNNQIKTTNENITYKNNSIDTLQVYVVTKTVINMIDYNNFLRSYKNDTQSLLVKDGLKIYYLLDNSANVYANILNLTWMRNTTTSLIMGIHNNYYYVECLDDNFGITVYGNLNNSKIFNLMMEFTVIKTENNIINSSNICIKKEFVDEEYINYTTDLLDLESPVNSNITIPSHIDKLDDLIDEYSNYDKSGIYEKFGLDEEKSILNNLLSKLGVDLPPEFNQIEAEFGNILMSVGSSLIPEGGYVSLILMGTGLALSADGSLCFAQTNNISRYITVGESVLTSLTYNKGFMGEVITKTGLTFTMETINQKFTGTPLDEIILKSTTQFISGNKYSTKFDNVVTEPLKKVGVRKPKSNCFIKNMFFNKKFSLEDHVIISSVSKVLVEKEFMVDSFSYSLNNLLKEYYGNNTYKYRLDGGVV